MSDRNPRRPMPAVRNQYRPESERVGYINDMVTCPYNPNHVMKYHKLMSHLPKCEKMSKGLAEGFEKCPYNSLHRYPAGKQDEHFRVCTARGDELMAKLNSNESLDGVDDRYSYMPKAKAPYKNQPE